jgi:hypothetical protein
MKTFFGFKTDTGLVSTREYTDWQDFLCCTEGQVIDHKHKVIFCTVLFEAESMNAAIDLVNKKLAHYDRKVARAIELDYWTEGVRGADI